MSTLVTFADLEAAARSRELLELRRPNGNRLAFLPLWPTVPGPGFEQGIAADRAHEGWAGVAYTDDRGKRSHGIEVIGPGHARTSAPGTILAPEPVPGRGAASGLIALEVLAIAARLGVRIGITYRSKRTGEVAPRDREIRDVRIKLPDLAKAFDMGSGEPRSFRLDSILGVPWADLAWTKADGWVANETQPGRARRLPFTRG